MGLSLLDFVLVGWQFRDELDRKHKARKINEGLKGYISD